MILSFVGSAQNPTILDRSLRQHNVFQRDGR